jgi:hypothetical protein
MAEAIFMYRPPAVRLSRISVDSDEFSKRGQARDFTSFFIFKQARSLASTQNTHTSAISPRDPGEFGQS